jgi:hypothetical protein
MDAGYLLQPSMLVSIRHLIDGCWSEFSAFNAGQHSTLDRWMLVRIFSLQRWSAFDS